MGDPGADLGKEKEVEVESSCAYLQEEARLLEVVRQRVRQRVELDLDAGGAHARWQFVEDLVLTLVDKVRDAWLDRVVDPVPLGLEFLAIPYDFFVVWGPGGGGESWDGQRNGVV